MNRPGLFITLFFLIGFGFLGYQSLFPPDNVGHSMDQPDLSDIGAGEAIADVVVPEQTLSHISL